MVQLRKLAAVVAASAALALGVSLSAGAVNYGPNYVKSTQTWNVPRVGNLRFDAYGQVDARTNVSSYLGVSASKYWSSGRQAYVRYWRKGLAPVDTGKKTTALSRGPHDVLHSVKTSIWDSPFWGATETTYFDGGVSYISWKR
ncbi:MAG: hypothetical protein LBJ02_09925 [Bifidobacteriaceae bacterium]|jgi:hypothetical protein|nr:hypothetical protein [Bifidobacteriaceae bacterium]